MSLIFEKSELQTINFQPETSAFVIWTQNSN